MSRWNVSGSRRSEFMQSVSRGILLYDKLHWLFRQTMSSWPLLSNRNDACQPISMFYWDVQCCTATNKCYGVFGMWRRQILSNEWCWVTSRKLQVKLPPLSKKNLTLRYTTKKNFAKRDFCLIIKKNLALSQDISPIFIEDITILVNGLYPYYEENSCS